MAIVGGVVSPFVANGVAQAVSRKKTHTRDKIADARQARRLRHAAPWKRLADKRKCSLCIDPGSVEVTVD